MTSSVVRPVFLFCQPHRCERLGHLPWLTALPFLPLGSRARGPGEVWGPHCHSGPPTGRVVAAGTWTPPASWGRQLLSLLHSCPSSSFLPPTPTLSPRLLHTFLTQSDPAFWMVCGGLWASRGKAPCRSAVFSACPSRPTTSLSSMCRRDSGPLCSSTPMGNSQLHHHG